MVPALVPKYLKSLPAHFPAQCMILLVFQAPLKYPQHRTTGESQMPKRDLHYFLGRRKPAVSEKQETVPGVQYSTRAPCPKPPLCQNSLSAWALQRFLSKWACPCHVSLSCHIEQFGSGCGQASLFLPSSSQFFISSPHSSQCLVQVSLFSSAPHIQLQFPPHALIFSHLPLPKF